MENTIDASVFENIYGTEQFWIGRRAAGSYESFYLIVQDQRAVSNTIAVRITKQDVTRILDSNGNLKVVDEIARNLNNGYLYVTEQKKSNNQGKGYSR